MSIKRLLGGSASGIVVLSVPLLALMALAPSGAASQYAEDPAHERIVAHKTVDDSVTSSSVAAILTSGGEATELSGWKYTGNSKKSAKSKKSKKSPKSKKSKKSKK